VSTTPPGISRSGADISTPTADAPRATAVPIEAVPSGADAPAAGPRARITLTAPTPPDGTLQAGSGPFTVPITIANAPAIGSLTLTLTYDPAVVRNPVVTQGSFMMQGGVAATFVPRVDPAAGRIDLAISRPPGQVGASLGGLVAAVAFTAGKAGATDLTITGVATSPAGQTVPLDFGSARIVVK
jgi:hypothetical protein